MNVFAFELRHQWKSVLSWTLILVLILLALMVAVYPVYLEGRSAVESILSGFPPAFTAALGLNLDDIFSYGGFYSFSSLYIQLCGAIMASMLGLGIFAREKRSKCTDFILTKPKSRHSLFMAKLLAALTLLTLSNIVYITALLLVYQAAPQSTAPLDHALLAASAVFFIELLFLAISVSVAVFSKKVRSLVGSAMAIGFGGFILTAVHSLLGEEWARYIAPMKYFNVGMAFSEGMFEAPYVITCAVLTVALLSLSFVRYITSDEHAV